uniref:Cyclin N-terminal domain-containing protein n=1 Tax=Echinococcus canadensis TaxID=519352 RepID=A0A915F0I3_9CEST
MASSSSFFIETVRENPIRKQNRTAKGKTEVSTCENLLYEYIEGESGTEECPSFEVQRDNELTRKYSVTFPFDCSVTTFHRAIIVDWMTMLQAYLKIDTKGLHMAVWLMDHYPWRKNATMGNYVVTALAALMVGDRITTTRSEDGCDNMRRDLVAFSDNRYCVELIVENETSMLNLFCCDLPLPTPHTFLKHCIQAMDDVAQIFDLQRAAALCLYCFDLGLLNCKLVQYSASLKCSAVVLLLRRLIKGSCICSREETNDPCNCCQFHQLCEWTEELKQTMDQEWNEELYFVSNIYAGLLKEAKCFNNHCKTKMIKGCAPAFEAAYIKHNKRVYMNIPISGILCYFIALSSIPPPRRVVKFPSKEKYFIICILEDWLLRVKLEGYGAKATMTEEFTEVVRIELRSAGRFITLHAHLDTSLGNPQKRSTSLRQMADGKNKRCDEEAENTKSMNRCLMDCQGKNPSTSRDHCEASPKEGECSTNPPMGQPANPSNQINPFESMPGCPTSQTAYPINEKNLSKNNRPFQDSLMFIADIIRSVTNPSGREYIAEIDHAAFCSHIKQPQNYGLGFYLRRANQPEIENSEMVPPNERAQAEIVSRWEATCDHRRVLCDEYSVSSGFSRWRLEHDMEKDTELMRAYVCTLPPNSAITASLRATIFDWMTLLQELMLIQSQSLHMAAWFVDHSEWCEEPKLGAYVLRALAALMIGDIAIASRAEDEWNNMRHDLIVFSEHNYSLEQVIREEKAITDKLSRDLPYPTPHNFLLPLMMISDDRNLPPEFNWGIPLCLYCLDLGLLSDQLAQYSAKFKCAAVVLLFRRIERSFCQCSTEKLSNPSNPCKYHRLSEMTELLCEIQAQEPNANLRSVSDIYAKLLREAQDFVMRGVQAEVECAPSRFEPERYTPLNLTNFEMPPMRHIDDSITVSAESTRSPDEDGQNKRDHTAQPNRLKTLQAPSFGLHPLVTKASSRQLYVLAVVTPSFDETSEMTLDH